MSENEYKWILHPGNPYCIGTTKTWNGYNFVIENPENKLLKLAFFKPGEKEAEQIFTIPQSCRFGNRYAVEIMYPHLHAYEYVYYLDGEPYADRNARLISGRNLFGQEEVPVRYRVLAPETVEELSDKIAYEDMIIYKIHVRGYTMQEDSGVTHKGTFAGLIEKIPYWKDLGVTSIQLMPAYDYLEYPLHRKKDTKLNYWGYTDAYYFAPKSSFAKESADLEMKQFMSELHKEGIECLMEFYFTERVSIDLAIDILRFWKMEYKVDGFVLSNCATWMESFAKDGILSDTKLMSNTWNKNHVSRDLPYKNPYLGEQNSAYQYTLRRFLKGDENQMDAFLTGCCKNSSSVRTINYITTHDGFPLIDLVSYNWRHNEGNGENNQDGLEENDSWNCGEEGAAKKEQTQQLRMRQMRNAMLLLLLGQGVPSIYGGDEFGNSQKGNNNAYCQDNPIGWIDWSQKEKMEPFTAFVKDVIRFRKSHPILHMPYPLVNSDPKEYGCPQISFHSENAWLSNTERHSRHAGILYCGTYTKDIGKTEDAYIYVAYNMHWAEKRLALPDASDHIEWYVAINSGQPAQEAVLGEGKEIHITDKKQICLPGRTIIVLIGK